MDYVLLTGCTGLIGRYLLRDLLVADVPVVTVARAADEASARRRLDSVFQACQQSVGRKLRQPTYLCGNLHQPGLGLSRASRRKLGLGRGCVLHNAGNVSFHNIRGDGEPWQTNVEGTRNLVELARDAGMDEFHYVSTAYVCGDRQGIIYETDLEAGQRFDSDYEHSKFMAERLVRAAGFRKLNVFRPGSVTGDRVTGETLTYHGFYLFAQFTQFAQQRAGAAPGERWHHPLRLFQTGMERHHLVPVDAVSSAIARIVRQEDLPAATYHVTPLKPCTTAELDAAMARYFGYYGLTFVGPPRPPAAELNEIEALFYEATARAEHRYCGSDPEFDCTNTLRALPEWRDLRVDPEYLHRTIDFAVRNRFGRTRKRKPSAVPA